MIYFDSAATTFQKPPEVAAAMMDAMNTMSSPGRGGYPAAMAAAETAFACREEVAELFHAKDPERVVFTMNATHGLNLAIKSLVGSGDRVVVSGYEHNAVTRPLAALGARVVVASAPLFRREELVRAFERQITPQTKAVVCNHVSNAFGFILPVEEIASICRYRKVPLIIDASQSAGVLPLNMQELGAAFLAFPGHKGLYGPQGTGVLLCGDQEPRPLLEGGTGSLSLSQEMPGFLPDRLEAGTHNMPGISGLLAGVRYVRRRGLDAICHHERSLIFLMAERLKQMPRVRVFSRSGLRDQAGVLSLIPGDRDVEQVGMLLAERGVAVRSGLHCAPLAHRSAGTLETGTLRLSVSALNTREECFRFLKIFREIMDVF